MSRILIVDDNAESRYLLQAVLNGMGHQVDATCDGAEALEAAQAARPDLVVSDILMPRMDGFTLCREWQADESLRSVPFVFYTATYTEAKDEAFALSLGAVRFLVKPQEPDVLASAISAVLEGNPAQPADESDLPATRPSVDSELDFLKQHRDAVIRKLEDKMGQLERANAALHRYVTERLRAQEALRESEERYRNLVSRSPDGIVLIDLKGKLLSVNEAICSKLGFTEAELLSMSLWDLVPREQWETHKARLARILAGENLDDTVEYDVRDKTGRLIPVEVRSAPYRVADRVVGFQAIARDITDRRRAEEERARLQDQLRQAQKMEAIGQLAGGVAHDFNNLLQAMLTQIQLAGARGDKRDQVLADLGTLEDYVKRGSALTRQLLLFARRETARPENLDLNRVIDGATTLLRHLVRANITLTVQTSGEPLPVHADHGQLDQVLVNLVVNGADAMPEGGRLTISCGREGDDRVWFSVEDTGHGIRGDIRERIFEPFFTTKAPGKGTGLGLAVVHGIVTSHRGWIEVSSVDGRGTTFKVLLPAAVGGRPSAGLEASPGAAAVPTGHGERILLVEDEVVAREGLRDILLSLGYDVTAVGSGEEAAELPAGEAFQVLLTDLILPGVEGRTLGDRLRGRWPSLKVILMSGYAEDEVVRRGAAEGMLRYLQKPFAVALLAREIRQALAE